MADKPTETTTQPPQKQEKKKKEKAEATAYINNTPEGQKKILTPEIAEEYMPAAVESAWYSWWEKSGFFKADNQDTKKEKYVVMLPPPNVTGSLHLGHALTSAIQDGLVRWHRMQGKNCLYLPGVDHAGIATQVVVEKTLQRDHKLSRHDLGRDKFIEKVWEWKEQYGKRIVLQLRRTGASLDWSRECFTMDEKLSKAVTEAFVRMYEMGLIYRDTRLVNWCCTLRTAISNIEVDHEDFTQPRKIPVPQHDPKKTYEFGYLWSFAYKIEDSEDEIVVSTTRPETMLGDAAVAVHPNDERYKKYHGKCVVHPFNGRKIPIITDAELVDPAFGTGAVKITPAHDFNDFKCGKRHNLQFINILNDDGTLNDNGAPFTGMHRYEVRYAIWKALEDKKLAKGKTPNVYNVGKCSRSGDVIEPMIKPQWFVNCDMLAKKSLDVVEKSTLNIVPESEKKTWHRWLGNIQEWCISRQLWWGHRIPAYFVSVKGQPAANKADGNYWVVARTKEEAAAKAAEKFKVDISDIILDQDEDVLDTWFSSGLFPFSTLGWPEKTPDLKAFYPGSLLETGLDILFFWVARMVMMGICLMDEVPFKEVFLHAMVRDKNGKKMSKSTGNVIDPLDCIEGTSLQALHEKLKSYNLSEKEIKSATELQKTQFPKGIPECGTDALRFTLLNYCAQGRDINLDIDRVYGYRTFCNKMWNAIRFALLNLTDFTLTADNELPDINQVGFVDKWILSRLNNTITVANQCLKDYDFYTYTVALYDFFLKELCDIYLEAIKPVMKSDDAKVKRAAQITLYTCLEQILRLMHPAMPFITEELWQRLPGRNLVPKERESIMLNPYPTAQDTWTNKAVEDAMTTLMEIVYRVRSVKAAYNLTYKQRPEIFIKTNSATEGLVKEQLVMLQTLASCGDVTCTSSIPIGCAAQVVNPTLEVFIMLKGLINAADEVKKLQKQREKTQQAYDALVKKVAIPSYTQKTPANVQQENQQKIETMASELIKLAENIAAMEQLDK